METPHQGQVSVGTASQEDVARPSGEGFGDLPVKNTFIHFGDSKRRSLRPIQSDPPPPLPVLSAPARSAGVLPPTDDMDVDSSTITSGICTPPSPTERGWQVHYGAVAFDPAASNPWAVAVGHRPQPNPVISLSEAIGADAPRTPRRMFSTPQRSPQAWAHELTPEPPSPIVHFFSITIRRADGVGLGLHVGRSSCDQVLLVEQVLQGGAIEAWNQQCVGTPQAGRAVVAGDVIVGVNNQSGCEAMLKEISGKQLLRLAIRRAAEGC